METSRKQRNFQIAKNATLHALCVFLQLPKSHKHTHTHIRTTVMKTSSSPFPSSPGLPWLETLFLLAAYARRWSSPFFPSPDSPGWKPYFCLLPTQEDGALLFFPHQTPLAGNLIFARCLHKKMEPWRARSSSQFHKNLTRVSCSLLKDTRTHNYECEKHAAAPMIMTHNDDSQ